MMTQAKLAEKQSLCRQVRARNRTPKEAAAQEMDESVCAMHLDRSAPRPTTARSRKKAYVLMYKQTHPCVDCGETDPVVLDFDHRQPEVKVNTVSQMINYAMLDEIAAEIAGCDVRCSNCHRRKHHRERVAAL